MDRALAGLGLDLGVVFEVVAGAERLVAGAGDDGDPQLRVGAELVECLDQLLVRHRVARVVDLGAVDRDDHQAAVGFDLAVLTHAFLCFLGWRAAVYRRYRHTKEPNAGYIDNCRGEERPNRKICPLVCLSSGMSRQSRAGCLSSCFAAVPFVACRRRTGLRRRLQAAAAALPAPKPATGTPSGAELVGKLLAERSTPSDPDVPLPQRNLTVPEPAFVPLTGPQIYGRGEEGRVRARPENPDSRGSRRVLSRTQDIVESAQGRRDGREKPAKSHCCPLATGPPRKGRAPCTSPIVVCIFRTELALTQPAVRPSGMP